MKKVLWAAALAALSIPLLRDATAESGHLRPAPPRKAGVEAAATPPAVLVARVSAPEALSEVPAKAADPEIRPVSLAAGDLDGDGVPDLIVGFASENGGVLVIQRGNIDAIYPNAPEARKRRAEGRFTDSPFLPGTQTVEISEAPDFLATGDFDNDGAMDVLAAARGGRALHLLSSDTRGDLAPARLYPISGALTALATGEWNRPDGLPDVVIGVIGDAGVGEVQTFSGEEGALRAKPESFPVGGPVTALALGRLDEDYTLDLAIGTGRDLVLLSGRDPMGGPDAANRLLGRYASEAFPISIAVGSYSGGPGGDVGVLGSDGTLRVFERRGQEATAAAATWQEPAAVGRGSLKARSGATLQFDGSLAVRPDETDIPLASLTGPFSWNEAKSKAQGGRATRLVPAGASDLVLWSADDPPRVLSLGRYGATASSVERRESVIDPGDSAVAVLPMRLNADAVPDLVFLREGSPTPGLVLSQAAATFNVNSAGDGADCNTSDGICATSSGGCPNGPCTLRAAIQQANASGGADVITFAIGSGPVTISPTSFLPILTGPVTIDGTSQPGFAGSPIVEIDGVSAGSANGLTVDGGTSTIRGLALNRFSLRGIEVRSAGNFIEGNYTGINVAGTAARSNLGDGILITNSPNNAVGGLVAAARNVASGNAGNGLQILGPSAINTLVQGNYAGTNPAGTAALGNGIGSPCSGGAPGSGVVSNGAPNNTIGGTVAGARNLISGNLCDGLVISGPGAGGNLIQGNYVGTNAAGTGAVPNAVNAFGGGIRVVAPNATVGGTAAGASNLISGNADDGVEIPRPDMTGNVVRSNRIGTDVTGMSDLGNLVAGVLVPLSPGAIVGGTAASARNIISGNTYGVALIAGATNILVQGNFIGVKSNGTEALKNDLDGVLIEDAPGNTIGGTTGVMTPAGICSGACNVISGNGENGVQITGAASSSNTVAGNFIGPDVDNGSNNGGNTLDGVLIDGAPDNTVGGAAPEALNYIAINDRHGVSLAGSGATGNRIRGNGIGRIISHQGASNAVRGVSVTGGASNNEIGGSGAGESNEIDIGTLGVVVESGTGNRILGNTFFGSLSLSNAQYAIDLGVDGPTANDAGDGDTGPNNLQNTPVITSITGGTVNGTLDSTPNTTFRLEFYNADCIRSAAGRGQQFLSFANVTTNAGGVANFSFAPPGAGPKVTSTATDPAGNTSEFSNCVSRPCTLQLADVSPKIIVFRQTGEGTVPQPQGGT